jgi:ankyrin repeat protein
VAQLQNKGDPAGASEDSPYAIMTAILNRDLDKASALIRGGTDVNFVDAFGDSAMRLAVRMRLDQVADWLIEAGGSMEQRRHWESLRPQADLNAAVRQGDEEAVTRLLDSGCDPNASDERGATPLYWAVEEDQPNILRLLLTRGADPNASVEGWVPSMHAIEAEALNATELRRDRDFRTTLLSILLESGADVHANSGGFTPLQFARKLGHGPAITLLRAYGATE